MLHHTNILIHITAGSIALLLGLAALVSYKGGKFHRKSGDLFLGCLAVVILTGLIGVFVFRRNTFLLVITVLSGYFGFSGYRALKMKSGRPGVLDNMVAVASLACVGYFLYYFRSIGMIWSPVIIYSTVGTLVVVIVYDFARYILPRYGQIWLYEHIFKMIGAFTALLSAFSGTVFYRYQPYSQFLPSVFGTVLQIGFIVYYATVRGKKKARAVSASLK